MVARTYVGDRVQSASAQLHLLLRLLLLFLLLFLVLLAVLFRRGLLISLPLRRLSLPFLLLLL